MWGVIAKKDLCVSKPSLFQKIKLIPLHPIFFAAYPVLALVGININEVEPAVLWRPLLVVLVGTVFLLALFGLVSKDWHRAALLLSMFIFLFLTYGHVYGYLKKIEFAGFILGRHRQMLPLWVGIGAFATWWVMRKLRNPTAFTPILNLLSIFLLIYPT